MTAAELTDEWIGRTVTVHCCRESHVGELTHVTRFRSRQIDGTLAVDAVEVRVGGKWSVVPPETVITDQEVSF